MKKIAFALLAAGFVLGAYATSLDVENVNWTLFVVAAIAATAGVFIAKQQDRARALAGDVLEGNRNELKESIATIVGDLDAATAGAAQTGEALRDWIDDTIRPHLRRFVDARESMVHLYGLQTYADIMSEFAAGERYVNRMWSASADGYDREASDYLARAAKQFREAQRQLEAASS